MDGQTQPADSHPNGDVRHTNGDGEPRPDLTPKDVHPNDVGFGKGLFGSWEQSPTPTDANGATTSPQPSGRTARNDSMTAAEDGVVDDENESKVLVIYTGGTIGMIRNDDNSE